MDVRSQAGGEGGEDAAPDARTRVAVVRVTGILIAQCLTEGYEVSRRLRVLTGLPEGSVMVGARWCEADQSLELEFEHSSFRAVKPGEALPNVGVFVGFPEQVMSGGCGHA